MTAVPRPRQGGDDFPEDGRVPILPDPVQLDFDSLMAGAEQAGDNADDWWLDCAERAVAELAGRGCEFAADDVRDVGVPEPDRANRWGSVFLRASRAGLIVPAGARRSTRGPRKGSLVRVWIGTDAARARGAA